MQRLSATDAGFLFAETPETPMHVGNIGIFELPENYEGNFFDNMLDIARSRLKEVPLMHWKLGEQPLNLDYPIWVEVPENEIEEEYHFKLEKLPLPGTYEQLYERVCELHMKMLDRERPLWQVYVFEGLADGKVAMYNKIHHACMDGQAGVQLAQVMMDLTPEPRAPLTDEQLAALGYNKKSAKLKPNLLTAVIDGVADRIKHPLLGQIKPVINAAREGARQMTGEGEDSVGKAPRSIFNAATSATRSFAAGEIQFADIKGIREKTGATINDIVVTITGGALRRYLKDRHALPADSLLCMAPVALDQKSGSANNVSGMIMSFGTNIADPLERLDAVAASSKIAKTNFEKLQNIIDEQGLRLPSFVTRPLMGMAASKLVGANMPAMFNAVLSNVKGLQMPVYSAGAKMVAAYPVSIINHGNTLNITVTSYMTKLDVGILGCGKIIPDPQKLARLMEDEVAALKAAVEPKATPEETPAAANENVAA